MDDLKRFVEHLRGLVALVKRHPKLTMIGYFLEMALVEAEEELARHGYRVTNPSPQKH
ncbi:Hypothetical protein NGAL_HAMBI1146_07710 [Neorhizobium galegae bv. officinalis]|nr:Hypothetical protein NGAL_HAMBI1146_07710 [Neorhizobium galegae bv. officinalis]